MKSFATIASEHRPPAAAGDDRDATTFAHWVRKTSELIGRSYMQTFKLVQHWPLHKIERRYKEAMNCNRDLTTPQIRWWSLRKKEKAALDASGGDNHL